MRKSELRKLIREVIQEQFKGKRRPNVTPQARAKHCWKIVKHADGVTFHCERESIAWASCGYNAYAGAHNNMLYSSQRSCRKAMMGMGLYTGPTPDFDQSFYDEWEGDYGYFPGQEITLNKNFN